MRPAVPVLATAALLVSSCSAPAGLTVQGTVADDVVVVAVPALAAPTIDLDAGFAPSPGSQPPAPSATTGAAPGSQAFVTVAGVEIAVGDAVTTGQRLVTLDDRLLRAQLKVSEAAAAGATAQVKVLDDRISDTRDAEAEIADKRTDVTQVIADLTSTRSDVRKAIAKLTRTRTDLLAQQATVRATRARLVAQRAEAQAALDRLPPAGTPLPPGAPSREQLQAAIAELTTGIKQLDAGLAKLSAGLHRLDAGLTTARKGLARINKGLSKARDGLRKLDDARQDVLDGRAQLVRLRRLADVATGSAGVGVDLARAQLAEAAITAPVSGTVVEVVATGDSLAPGASLVTIRRSGEATTATWLSPAQTSRVCVGDSATVHGDWMAAGQDVSATIATIASRAEFPPTSQATDEVHLTRAFLVELHSASALPPGVPVTISIRPCQPGSPAPTR